MKKTFSQVLFTFLFATTSLFFTSCEEKLSDAGPVFSYKSLTQGDGTIQFTSELQGDSYEWNFGDGTTSNEANPKKQYLRNGKYTVILIVKNKRSQATKIYEIEVLDAPKPLTKFSQKATGNGTFVFTNETQNADSYSYDFGDGTTSQEASPTKTYKRNGTYEVALKARNFNGTSEAKQTITVADAIKPTADFVVESESGGLVTFKNLSKEAESYEWTFGNGEVSTAINGIVGYSRNGTYTVTLKAKNYNGESIKIKQINVTSRPTTGSVIFYLDKNLSVGGGKIDIKVESIYRGTLSSYYASGFPGCGASGGVTYTDKPGAYSYTAVTYDGRYKWSGIINVEIDQCKGLVLSL